MSVFAKISPRMTPKILRPLQRGRRSHVSAVAAACSHLNLFIAHSPFSDNLAVLRSERGIWYHQYPLSALEASRKRKHSVCGKLQKDIDRRNACISSINAYGSCEMARNETAMKSARMISAMRRSEASWWRVPNFIMMRPKAKSRSSRRCDIVEEECIIRRA